jgi:hypothetical protein
MPRLADVVRLAPNFLLGSVVARAPRLRKLESWVITRVHPARGGGNPVVYGVRFERMGAGGGGGAPEATAAVEVEADVAAGARAGAGSKSAAALVAPVVAAPTRIDGVLKPDWVVVRDAGASAPARSAKIVRTNVGFSLSADLVLSALRGGAPFDGVGADAAEARHAAAKAIAVRKEKATAAAAAAAAAEAAAAAAAADKGSEAPAAAAGEGVKASPEAVAAKA